MKFKLEVLADFKVIHFDSDYVASRQNVRQFCEPDSQKANMTADVRDHEQKKSDSS